MWKFCSAKLKNTLTTFVTENCFVLEKKSHDVKKCIFPFKYSGQTFHRCTALHDPELKTWCSTMVDGEGNHLTSGGFWGHCGQDCSKKIPSNQNETLLKNQGNNLFSFLLDHI